MLKKLVTATRTGQSILVLVLLLMAGCGNFGLNEEQLLQRAKMFMEQREYIAAAIEIRNTLQKNPDNAEARYILGEITLEYGDYPAAEREFRRADLEGWGDGNARIGRARALYELGEYQKLATDVEVEAGYPNSVKAGLLALRAAGEASLEETDKARATLGEAVALDPAAFQVYMTQIQLLLDDDDLQAANARINEALEKYPGNPELLLLQAEIFIAEGDAGAGKQLLQAIIESDPPNFISIYGVNARLDLVEQLILEGELDEAQRYLAPLFRRTANAAYTNYLGGLLAFEQGKYDLAEQRLLKVLKVTPDHAPTRLLFAAVNFAQKDYEQAAYFLSKYLAVNPENLAARKLLGRSYMLLGQLDNAVDVLEQGETTDDAVLLGMVGLSELQRGNAATGIARLKDALAEDPESVELRKELVLAYLSTDEANLAIEELQNLVKAGDTQLHTESLMLTAYLQAGEFERAIDLSLEILSRSPQDPASISLAGTVFAASGDLPEARKYFSRALSIKPDFYPAAVALARIEELEGNTDKAIERYRKLVDADVDSVVPVLALARLEGKQGNTQQVVDLLQAASKDFPDEDRPRLLLAEHYLREKQYRKAGLLLDEADRIKPDQPVVLYLRAKLLIATGHPEEAVSTLKKLLEVEPGSAAAQVLLAETYLHMGSVQNTRNVLQKVLGQDPDNVAALALLTKLEILSGNLGEAMRLSQRIQQEYPGLYLGYELQGDVWVKKKNDDKAGKQYAQAWERMQRSGLAIKQAEIALRAGNDDVAIDLLVSWLGNHPGDVRVRRFLGTTYYDTGHAEQAVTEYLKVLAINPDDKSALNNLAWIYFQGNNPEARKMAKRAYRIDPDNAGILDTYGWILVNEDDVEQGMQLLRQAHRQLPGVAEVGYHYAVALYKSGDKQQARELLEDLLAGGKPFDSLEPARQLLKEIRG